jgi:uncharacterized BrkB/YihY/UPF0761 family membrane protein
MAKKPQFRVVKIYTQSNGNLMAKGIAFSLLFGSLPLLFLLVSLRRFITFPVFMGLIEQELLGMFPPEIRSSIVQVLIGGAARFSIPDFFTLVTFIWAVNNLFTDLGTGMATMLGAPENKPLIHRLYAFPLMALFVLLFYLASITLPTIRLLQGHVGLPSLVNVTIGRGISTLVYTGILFGLYLLFAGQQLRLVPTGVIALITSVLWQLFTLLGSRIIFGLGGRLLILGAVATVMVVLFIMKLLAELFLFSSVCVRIYAIPKGIAESEAEHTQGNTLSKTRNYLKAGIVKEDDQ